MRLVLDASVAIASLRPLDPGHAAARARVRRIAHADDVAIVPSFFIAEVSAALGRLGHSPADIDAFVGVLVDAPHEVFVIGPKRATAAAALAVATGIRGPASLYVWLGIREGVPVCTLDREMAQRGASACQIVAP